MVELDEELEARDDAVAAAAAGALWFVCCVANPVGYKSRNVLYEGFMRHVLQDLGGRLAVVECAYGDREHVLAGVGAEFATPETFLHVPVRAQSVLWHKESLLNVGIAALPPDCKYVVWADADIHFIKGSGAVLRDIVRALDAHPVVQCFNTCLDLGPAGEVLKLDHGYAFSAAQRLPAFWAHDQTTWHSGYCWAARRDFLIAVGGLFDAAILGSGDRLMADALLDNLRPNPARGDVVAAEEWGCRATSVMADGEDVGYVPLVIKHGFHGRKRDRGYSTRGAILVRHAFDPATDLRRNSDGLLEWAGNKPELEAEVLRYFHRRKEDCTVAR